MKKLIYLFIGLFICTYAHTKKINTVAAENQYGNIAKLIGGDKVKVTSIINNADGDPHTFTSSIKIAKLLDEADIIIYNGVGYDSWINPIIKNYKNVATIKVQDLNNYTEVPNLSIDPHLWYDPKTFPALAKKLVSTYSKLDRENSSFYGENYQKFNKEYKKLLELISDINKKYKGTYVSATEPLFGYMAEALGLKMKGLDFQRIIMNDSEPSPQMMINYQKLFTKKEISVLFYNKQVTDNITQNILNLANKNGIPVVGITESMPADENAISWMIKNLKATEKALNQAKNK